MSTTALQSPVLDEILHRILAQNDDDSPHHDGYQRRLVMVEGRTQHEANEAADWLAARVREDYGAKRHDELREWTCDDPPGRRRYEFGPGHMRQILAACGIEDPKRVPLWRTDMPETWPNPTLLFIRNADAMARTGRTGRKHLQRAGDWIRMLSDGTRVRQVLFGSQGLREIYLANESFQYRTDAFHLDPEENRRRMRATKLSMSELTWKTTTGATVH